MEFNISNLNVSEFLKNTSKNNGSKPFISRSGVYLVKIDYVRIWENKTGSKSFSIVCSLEGSDDTTIVYGSVFQKANGEKNGVGYDQITSLQVVCGINKLTTAKKTVKSFKDDSDFEIEVFKEFEDKKVLLQVVREYSQYNGNIRSSLVFRDVFRTNDNANAAEILSKKDFGSKMKWIKDNPDKVEESRYVDCTKEEVKAWLDSKKNNEGTLNLDGTKEKEELPF